LRKAAIPFSMGIARKGNVRNPKALPQSTAQSGGWHAIEMETKFSWTQRTSLPACIPQLLQSITKRKTSCDEHRAQTLK
jgi:hypothetical protein